MEKEGKDKSTLEFFFRTGQIGPLNFSNSVSDIYSLLGEPNWVDKWDYPEYSQELLVLYYGNLTITFVNENMESINLIFGEKSIELSEKLKTDWFNDLSTMKVTDLVNFLRKNSISCKKVIHEFVEPHVLLWIEQLDQNVPFLQDNFESERPNMDIIFLQDKKGNYKLDKICVHITILNRPVEDCW